ncbi:MAG: 4Fe-4S binding protein [Saprospiraceae bacterium]|nr:4Fe-4S binding protein [Saprospiraceae bacterium]
MYEEFEHDTEAYRDSVATIGKDGKRVWLYPKKPSGRFYNARTWTTVGFLAIFLTLPFITHQGEPIFLLNVLERKFIIFGLLFMPQDFHLFVLAMLTFIVFIVLFTVVFGRLFCGWVCPQTVFMEMIFRRIEYWIEGDANAQRRLNNADWSAEKIRKKALKHAIFFLIAVVVANYFLAYVIGMKEVTKIISEPVTQHVGGFAAMILFSFVFYGVFARMREQVCTTICPYGRLQSVLLVPDSIVVAYDFVRGEPRGKIKKQKEPLRKEPCKSDCPDCEECAAARAAKNILESIQETATVVEPPKRVVGDCIDCNLCVQVCPTGIDIRNGTQLECTNCTACIDACDEVMVKVNRPKGLIRYDSLNGIKAGKRKIFTVRVAAYSVVLAILLGLDVFLLTGRSDIETTVLRSPGQMFQEVDAQHISNLYTFQIVNKTHKDMPLVLKIKDDAGVLKFVGATTAPSVSAGKMSEGAFFIEMDKSKLTGVKTTLYIEVYSDNKLMDKVKTSFVGPMY